MGFHLEQTLPETAVYFPRVKRGLKLAEILSLWREIEFHRGQPSCCPLLHYNKVHLIYESIIYKLGDRTEYERFLPV